MKKTRAELTDYYQQRIGQLSAEIGRLQRRNKAFAVGELLSFALAVAAVAGHVSTDTGYTLLYISGLLLAVYVLIRQWDLRNSLRTQQLEDRRQVYRHEAAYLGGDFSGFDDGSAYADASHPFALDMDVFGPGSLFHRLNRTVTTGGSRLLATELTEWTCADTAARQEAIGELAEREELRTAFLALGQRHTIDTGKVEECLHAMQAQALPSAAGAGAAVAAVAAGAGMVGVCTVVVLAVMGVVPASAALLWVFVQFGVVFAANNVAFRRATSAANRMHKELGTCVALITAIVESGLQARESRDIIGQLSGAPASFAELCRILDALDRQGNALYRFLSDAFCCYDFWIVRRFRRWQEQWSGQAGQWMGAASHFDALVSMATFRYNEPAATEAEMTDSDDRVVYEAEGLAHPFLGEKAVSNDCTLCDRHYYIVTGANMAGKSTFLRTIGVNYILARCGMPVFARRLKASRFALFSSMRTTDDLTQGISYFNAELLRLQQLIAFCRHNGPRPTLIILDEILKGTNSLDKLNGSRLFLEHVLRLPVTGIIATHDLELSKMADEHPDRFHNRCFEIGLSGNVTYTYKITEGVARNQNATFLLKNIVLREISARKTQEGTET